MNLASPLKAFLLAIGMLASATPMALAAPSLPSSATSVAPFKLTPDAIGQLATLQKAPSYRQTCAGVAWQARHGLSSAQYQQAFDQMTAAGYRPVQVNGYAKETGAEQYAAIWDKCTTGPWSARHNLTAAQYQQELNRMTSLGYQPVWVSGYEVNSQPRFAGIWEKKPNSNAWRMRFGMNPSEYIQEQAQRISEGYDLVQVSSYGFDTYAAIWEKQSTGYSLNSAGLLLDQYQGELTSRPAMGYFPLQVSMAKRVVSTKPFCTPLVCEPSIRVRDKVADTYTGIFVKRPIKGWIALQRMTSSDYQQQFNQWTGQGYRLMNVTAGDVNGEIRYSAIWEK
jgi:Bacterial tandem repeat domain 1